MPSTASSFDTAVAPILQKHCIECHGESGAEGDLDLRTLAGIERGGESGQVIAFGSPEKSFLFEKVTSGEMPPDERTKLTEEEVGAIHHWIASTKPASTLPATSDVARAAYNVLELKCLPCHGEKRQEGELDLRTLAAMLTGGKSGPAIVRGHAEESLIVRHVTDDLMPPRELRAEASINPVTVSELNTLKQWIDDGAEEPPPWPGDDKDDSEQLSPEDRHWWAFQPPRQAPIPIVAQQHRARTPIDYFVLERLERERLGFSPDAEPRTLARRAYLYVTGLPPTPREMDAFLQDKKVGAYERLVDKLLASPRYGERWAQFWLDAAGYADSEGATDDDPVWEEFWRYRDYVIRSLNADKPYGQFLTEQFAGDELTDFRNAKEITPQIRDNLIATGFLRGGIDPTTTPAVNFLPERHQVLADKMEMVGSAIMGLTLHCARCHSHKYDPIPQRDYYRMTAIFAAAYAPMDWRKPSERYLTLATRAEQEKAQVHNLKIDAEGKPFEAPLEQLRKQFRPQLLEQKIASLAPDIRQRLRDVVAVPVEKRTEAQKTLAALYAEQLKADDQELASAFPDFKQKSEEPLAQLARIEAKKIRLDRAFGLTDIRPDPLPFHLLRRGNSYDRVHEVRPDVLAVLKNSTNPFAAEQPWVGAPTSGRRLALARWLTHAEHPLTARVIVNRVWQNYFGKGIVETVENFGRTGAPPTHPELLDWLSVEFVKQGWSLKALHRLILTSTAFRQQSQITEQGSLGDPENHLLWRMPLRRLDAEAIRDSVLACSGALRSEMFGPPAPVDIKPDGQVVSADAPEHFRRSIYVLHRRSKPVSMLETFDAPPLSVNCTLRRTSNVVSQPLMMFNSQFMADQAARVSERIQSQPLHSQADRINSLYDLLLSRPPTESERALATRFLRNQSALYATAQDEPHESAQKEAWVDFCLVLLNSAEFTYVD
ncbi:MAG: DUF1553 domain-containing protein [Pirellulales bacterium]|nr:DUF1553 domain-containing protein [Pirellulales bacterium]